MAANADAAKPVIMNEEELKRKQKEKLKKLQATGGNPRPARSLFFFTLKNPFRKACINIVEWKYPLKLPHTHTHTEREQQAAALLLANMFLSSHNPCCVTASVFFCNP